MKLEATHLEKLKYDTEKSCGHPLNTSKDFEILKFQMKERIGDYLSTTTLKRIWGYVGGYKGIREDSLNFLSRFLGYPDWKTYVADRCGDKKKRSSHFIITNALLAEDIANNDIVEIYWEPKRRLLVKCLGNGQFETIEAENSKITAGDTFRCERFIIGEPLYINNLIHNGEAPRLFVAGKTGGLTKVEVLSNED